MCSRRTLVATAFHRLGFRGKTGSEDGVGRRLMRVSGLETPSPSSMALEHLSHDRTCMEELFVDGNGGNPAKNNGHYCDPVDESISDEDYMAPTNLSFAGGVSAAGQVNRYNKVDVDQEPGWSEVLEATDELFCLHNEPRKASFTFGQSRKRVKGASKPQFTFGSHAHEEPSSSTFDDIAEKDYPQDEDISSSERIQEKTKTVMELFENHKEDPDDLPIEHLPSKNQVVASIAELLDDLQEKDSSHRASVMPKTKGKDQIGNSSEPGKKIKYCLGTRILDTDDPLENAASESSDEEKINGKTRLAPQAGRDFQTVADVFQEYLKFPSFQVPAPLVIKNAGTGYHARLQQIIQSEKENQLEFLRQSNVEHNLSSDNDGGTVHILARSLEGKLTVCQCSTGNDRDCCSDANDDDGERTAKMTVIFSSKICDNVDLVVGNIIHIYPPWKEVMIEDQKIILATYFSHGGDNDRNM